MFRNANAMVLVEVSFKGVASTHLVALSMHLDTYLAGGARGVMVIVVGNGLGDTSSNPG